MKHIEIIMPQVKACNAKACAYNKDMSCHARAITIGDASNPGCDTFFTVPIKSAHAKSVGRQSGVGACKVGDCKYNEDYECMADEIMIGFDNSKASCKTYVHQ